MTTSSALALDASAASPTRSVRPRPTSRGVRLTSVPTGVTVAPTVSLQGVLDLGPDLDPGRAHHDRLSRSSDAGGAELRVVSSDAGELDAFAARFAQVVVEVIGGDRGLHQLMRWTTSRVYADLTRRTTLLARTTPGDQRGRRLRAQVRSVHLYRPGPDAAELSIHVRHGQRSRAIAARIEVIEGRWRCCALQFG